MVSFLLCLCGSSEGLCEGLRDVLRLALVACLEGGVVVGYMPLVGLAGVALCP